MTYPRQQKRCTRNQSSQDNASYLDFNPNLQYPNQGPHLGNHQPMVCQLYDKQGHFAKTCRSHSRLKFSTNWPQANYLSSYTNSNNSNWIVDSGAFHHITSDLQNLSMHSEYGENEDMLVGNGKNVPITHIGSNMLNSSYYTFKLNDVLYASHTKKNLLFVSQLCKENNTSIEFFPHMFLMKELSMRASLVHSQ